MTVQAVTYPLFQNSVLFSTANRILSKGTNPAYKTIAFGALKVVFEPQTVVFESFSMQRLNQWQGVENSGRCGTITLASGIWDISRIRYWHL